MLSSKVKILNKTKVICRFEENYRLCYKIIGTFHNVELNFVTFNELTICLFTNFRIGLCGFDNPMRNAKTDEAKRHINQGVKIKMDEQGNILIRRLCKSNVYVRATKQDDNAIGSEILRNPQGALEHEKPGKV